MFVAVRRGESLSCYEYRGRKRVEVFLGREVHFQSVLVNDSVTHAARVSEKLNDKAFDFVLGNCEPATGLLGFVILHLVASFPQSRATSLGQEIDAQLWLSAQYIDVC